MDICEPIDLTINEDASSYCQIGMQSSEHDGHCAGNFRIDESVSLVKETSFLFSRYHEDYRDTNAKVARWREIGSEAKKKWISVRDRYKQILNKTLEHLQSNKVY